jgi:hypothetical protein
MTSEGAKEVKREKYNVGMDMNFTHCRSQLVNHRE